MAFGNIALKKNHFNGKKYGFLRRKKADWKGLVLPAKKAGGSDELHFKFPASLDKSLTCVSTGIKWSLLGLTSWSEFDLVRWGKFGMGCFCLVAILGIAPVIATLPPG